MKLILACEQEVGHHQVIVSFFVVGSFKGSGVVHLSCQFIHESRAVQLGEHHKNAFLFINSQYDLRTCTHKNMHKTEQQLKHKEACAFV